MSYVLGLDSTIKSTERLNGTTASEILQWDGSQWQHRGAAVGTPLYDTYVGGLEVVGAKDLIWNTDGGGDIGATGATRPDNVYVKTAVTIAGATAMKGGDSAGGDLGGTYPSPTVTADSHAHTATSITLALSALSDATITSPTDGALLLYDTGTAKWRDAAMSGDATITDLGAITVTTIGGVSPLLTTTTFGGDVTSTYGSIQVLGSSGDFVVGNLLQLHDFGAGASGASATGHMWISDPTSSMKVLNYWDASAGVGKIVVDNTTAFLGDVTGTYGATVVGDDTHNHTASTLTMASTDLTNTTSIVLTSTSFAGDVTGTSGATVVGDDSHAHTASTLTLGSIKSLSDVYSSMSPSDGNVLTYDTTNGWQAEAPGGGLPSGTTNDLLQCVSGTTWDGVGAGSGDRILGTIYGTSLDMSTQVKVGTYITVKSDRVSFGDLGFSAISSPVDGDVWYDSTEGGLLTRSSLGGAGNRVILHAYTTIAGDVSGKYNTTSVDKISGVTVDTTAPVTDEKLVYNGSEWHNTKTSRVRAYSSSNENVTTTFEKVHYDTETYDTRSEYDASTNYRFTATEAGYYLVSTTILWEVINGGYVVAEIRRNGTTVSYNKMYSTTVENSSQSQVVTDVIYLTASQYVEVWVANYTGDGGYIGGGETKYTYLCVHKMI